MDILYRKGRASVAEVLAELSGNPAYSTVRAQLRVLEEKGHVKHEEQGLRYVYLPKLSRKAARHSVLRHVVDTFFEGSTSQVMAALLGGSASPPSEEELKHIEQLIERARKEGRQ